ncbi:MAG: hydrolase [Tissierellia bacterium]|nr:hydrolase [Tissierellia bacterium]
MQKDKIYIPEVTSNLRKSFVKVPEVIQEASGIRIFGKKLHSFIFTTDVAIIKNTNADAVIAVYSFTPQPAITQAIMSVADIPVLCGVGGGLTQGNRSVNIALHAEFQGAIAVVLNAPTPEDTIRRVREQVDIPVVITIVSECTNIQEKLDAGADILNVSGGAKTAEIVRKIRYDYPHVPIIATGGPTDETIMRTIDAGANGITYTPPTNGELFKVKMEQYRIQENDKYLSDYGELKRTDNL